MFEMEKSLPALPAITEDKVRLYLGFLAVSGRKRQSAIKAGLEPTSFFHWRDQPDNEIVKQMEVEAMQLFCEVIEKEITRRAIKGVKEPVFYQGEVCGYVRKKSDRLLLALAKRHIREYHDTHHVEATITAGVLVVQESLSPDEWSNTYGRKIIDAGQVGALPGAGTGKEGGDSAGSPGTAVPDNRRCSEQTELGSGSGEPSGSADDSGSADSEPEED